MSTEIEFIGKWIGVFAQQLNGEEFIEVDFEMSIKENNDGFEGK